MKLRAELDLMKVTRENLEAFLEKAPADAEFSAEVDIEKADRPFDSDRTEARLVATWEL